MQYGIHILGILAAALTSLSYLPQLQKAIPRHSTSDLALKMLVALSTGYAFGLSTALRKTIG
jgi:MtN3 and saliva related transmembrane protein